MLSSDIDFVLAVVASEVFAPSCWVLAARLAGQTKVGCVYISRIRAQPSG